MEKRPRALKRRKKYTASASFLDPVLRKHVKPSLERQVRFNSNRLRDYCYGGGKSRGSFKSWLDISNGYIQSLPEVKKSIKPSRSFSNLKKPLPKNRMSEKPMFILISEKEVNKN